jgi:hypothetical protein
MSFDLRESLIQNEISMVMYTKAFKKTTLRTVVLTVTGGLPAKEKTINKIESNPNIIMGNPIPIRE